VPQGRNLFGQLTVFQNLELGGITLGTKTTHERIPEVLEFFPRVKERLHSQASALSGGEQKQLEIGRALLLRPKVLLIDEPSIGLSPMVVQDVFKLLQRLADAGHDGADGRAERQERAEDLRRGHRARIRPAGAAAAGERSCWPIRTSSACSWAAAMCPVRPCRSAAQPPDHAGNLNRRRCP
jgi:ABC-type cobalamin transport system ATPase subunit